jgi:3-hydroxyacyl-[acyl-carrier-protein] dehydratase
VNGEGDRRGPDERIDIEGILARLPHRHPFVLIDRVIELVPNERVLAIKCVAFNEPWFVGHFPARPIMPGVLIVEALAQAGGILAHASLSTNETIESAQSVLLLGIDRARFRRPVVPGDRLELHVEKMRSRSGVWKLSGRALVDGALAAEADLLASVGPR